MEDDSKLKDLMSSETWTISRIVLHFTAWHLTFLNLTFGVPDYDFPADVHVGPPFLQHLRIDTKYVLKIEAKNLMGLLVPKCNQICQMLDR